MHTSEPWAIHEQGEPNQWAILGPDGRWVIGLIHNGEMLPEKQRATLERIVACVNACAGMANPVERVKELKHLAAEAADEGGSYGGGKTIIEMERDQLLAALRKLDRAYVNLLEIGRDRIVERGGTCDPVEVMEKGDPVLREVRAVIAKVQP